MFSPFMAYSHVSLEIVFLISVAALWGMIFYQLIFSYAGLLHFRRGLKQRAELDARDDASLPGVSILVPAHNEELVIEKTLESLCALEYPRERLEIIVVNDGSTDATAAIVEQLAARDDRVKLFNVPVDQAAQGKSHALNLGLQTATRDYFAIYDADNTPEPSSLRRLMHALVADERLAGVFGKFRTRNRRRNLLTRFINLETLAFQHIVQAGRHLITGIAILPGTNLVIRRKAFEAVGGWDEDALTEDTELSVRLYLAGWRIQFVQSAVTWEEEPETWGTWVRQRTRWVRGNFYVVRKCLWPTIRAGRVLMAIELAHLFLLYYVFLCAILISHLIFIGGAVGWIAVLAPGPYTAVWICAILLFLAEVTLAAALEDEATPWNVAIAALMYFTYCQAWIFLVFRAAWQETVMRGKVKWEKTRRFASIEDSHAAD